MFENITKKINKLPDGLPPQSNLYLDSAFYTGGIQGRIPIEL